MFCDKIEIPTIVVNHGDSIMKKCRNIIIVVIVLIVAFCGIVFVSEVSNDHYLYHLTLDIDTLMLQEQYIEAIKQVESQARYKKLVDIYSNRTVDPLHIRNRINAIEQMYQFAVEGRTIKAKKEEAAFLYEFDALKNILSSSETYKHENDTMLAVDENGLLTLRKVSETTISTSISNEKTDPGRIKECVSAMESFDDFVRALNYLPNSEKHRQETHWLKAAFVNEIFDEIQAGLEGRLDNLTFEAASERAKTINRIFQSKSLDGIREYCWRYDSFSSIILEIDEAYLWEGIKKDIEAMNISDAIKKLESFELEYNTEIPKNENIRNELNDFKNSFVSVLYDTIYDQILFNPDCTISLSEIDRLLKSRILNKENRSYWHLSVLEALKAGYRCPNLSSSSWQGENKEAFLSLSRNGDFYILLWGWNPKVGGYGWQEHARGTYEIELRQNRIVLTYGNTRDYLVINTSGLRSNTWLYDPIDGIIYR